MNFFLKTVFCLLLSLNFLCSKNIIIGTSIDYPPFEYSSLGYKIVGFDIDLIEAIGKKRGLKFKIVNLAYDELIPNLINGKIDIIASALSITNERIKLIDFTNPYFETENIYIKNKNNKLINSKEDLKGKKIGVIKGMQQENSIKEEIQNAKIVTFSNASNAVMALSFGDIDALILDLAVGLTYIGKNVSITEFHREPYISTGFAFGVRKNDNSNLANELNMGLSELELDGTYDELLQKYNLNN